MKKILIALSVAGFLSYTAGAQTTHSRNDINYKVCRTNSGYKVCSGPYNAVPKKYETRMPEQTNDPAENNDVIPLSKGRGKYDVNYKVCRVDDQYQVCNPDEPVNQTTDPYNQYTSVNTGNSASMRMMETGAHMGYTSKRRSNIKVWDEDNAQQKVDMETGGIEKAKRRNINYNNGSVSLPPNDGGITNR
jgi:hypothetical protein